MLRFNINILLLFNESQSIQFISASILDSDWLHEINCKSNEPTLIIAEGLLMYFTPEEVESIFNLLIDSFPNAEMCFDIVHKFFVGKGISSKFKWELKMQKKLNN